MKALEKRLLLCMVMNENTRKKATQTCEPRSLLAGILLISSMLAETENLLLSLSSTAAIMIDDVRWPYFFCHVYVSNDTSFFSSLRIGLFGPDEGLKSVRFSSLSRNEHNLM